MENFKPKESNLELLRIINMLLIIAHHLAVHTPFVFENIHIKYIVDKTLKIKNLFRIWIDVFFYSITILVFFYFYDKSYIYNIKFYIFPITYSLYWFITTYFIMYIILYFFNFQLYNIERKRYLKFIIILVIFWSILSSFPNTNLGYTNILWFILLYLIGGYIKLYINKIKNKYLYLFVGIFFYFIIFIRTIINHSVLESDKYIITHYIEMNDFFILLVSILLLLFFSNLNIKYNKYINIISSTTLGIYLIHDNPSVRTFLWTSYFKLFEITGGKNLILSSIKIIFTIFFICMIIDLIRKFIIEVLLKRKINQIYEILVFLNDKIDKFL